ncbi:hypothetical protein P5673_017116 [Acropora cervicornis]|uniref:Uncharacterized protein n=1 Tax=Acropora cervicornis TaxID=6130 RepID=A0AAD9QF42_ACRCE|nr:hypothetical protein P5673_017116 [Acropora cervicornis]
MREGVERYVGFPIIPVVISLGISSKDGGVLQNYTNPNFCWLSFSNKLSWSFIAPVLIVTLGLLIFLLHVVRNSDVRAEIHHKLLKWRFERSVNRAQEKSSTSTSRAKQRCCTESRDEMQNTQHSL